jgi:L-ascorbate metabolism protein UlaG (beta-lactamase superfamily)
MTMASPAPLAEQAARFQVPAGQVRVWWLGGSGFIFKAASGRQIWIDPYLSDSVFGIFGVKRAFPAPLSLEEAAPDVVVSTHWHEDHLDPGTIPELARRRPGTLFVMPPSAMSRALAWGVPRSRIVPLSHGGTETLAGASLTAVPARHEAGVPGWEVPDAMGVILEIDGVRIYHTGDTEYDVRLRRLRGQPFALATFCINGVSGNMNAHEAALLAWHLDAGTVVPHHHLIWAKDAADPGETLDPRLFEETYRKLGGAATVILPVVGAGFQLGPGGALL